MREFKTYVTHLLSHGRELEHVQRLIIHRRALINVYNHTGWAPACEVALQIVSEFTLSERNMLSERTKKTKKTQWLKDKEGKPEKKKRENDIYLACWLFLSALMHFPRLSREVLMLPASLSRSPLFWVLAQRSDPARSHSDSLEGEYIHFYKPLCTTQTPCRERLTRWLTPLWVFPHPPPSGFGQRKYCD